MKNIISTFTSEESGQGMVEYGLIISLVSVAIIGTLTLLGEGLDDTFTDIIAELQ